MSTVQIFKVNCARIAGFKNSRRPEVIDPATTLILSLVRIQKTGNWINLRKEYTHLW